jgi:transposase
MRLINNLAKYGRSYQNEINNLPRRVNRNSLSENNKKNYNTILKGLNAIRAELKKDNNRLNQLRTAQRMRIKHRRATKVQAYIRGFLERRRQNKARYVVGPNGRISIAVVPHRASGFRAIAAKRTAEKRNLNRLLQGFAN